MKNIALKDWTLFIGFAAVILALPILLTPFGAIEIAGHQVASSFCSLAFMVPLSISIAVTIRVGYLFGRGDPERLQQVVKTAFTIAAALAISVALLNYSLREHIASVYSNDLHVIRLAASILVLGSIYQLSDAIQVVSNGVLRGFKDTSIIFGITFIAYWPIGLGVGYILGLTDWVTETPIGALGFWTGIICGLTFAAIFLALRVRKTLAKITRDLK